MKRFIFLLTFISISSLAFSQSAFLESHDDSYILLDRLDVLNKSVSDTLHTALHPISQKNTIHFIEAYVKNHEATLSEIDRWNLQQLRSSIGEWASDSSAFIHSKHPLFKTIYALPSDMFHVSNKEYAIIVNPIIYYQQGFESKNNQQHLFINSRGLELSGHINKRLGFYTRFTDNQERGPVSHQYYVQTHQAIPDATYYKTFKPNKPGAAQDYLNATGYVDADILKDKVNVTFGHDKFQIGDGYRSLFLSDFGSNYLFLRLNTQVGRFNYQNLFMELTPQYDRGLDRLLPKKYAAMHHLSVNATNWLNLGLFETVIFHRENHFELQYLNPIILYRMVEQSNGSPDNALLGLNFKINTKHKTILYGQAILDEFKFGQLVKHNGWWGNKYGVQVGAKIADLFGIKPLLIQPEFVLIRPFTYSYGDSIADYSHYNQSLAHPYGANLMEASLNIHYQPIKKLELSLRTFYIKQGRDTASTVSFGGNIFNSYTNRSSEFGIFMFNGYPSNVVYANLNMSYQIKNHFFFDLGFVYRDEKASHPSNPTYSSFMLYTGLRLNANRRQYDY